MDCHGILNQVKTDQAMNYRKGVSLRTSRASENVHMDPVQNFTDKTLHGSATSTDWRETISYIDGPKIKTRLTGACYASSKLLFKCILDFNLPIICLYLY